MRNLLLLISLSYVSVTGQNDRVQRVGNKIVTPTGSSDYKFTSFLLPTTVQNDGILFAFSAYFMNKNSFGFQIWREEDKNAKTFKLLKQWDIIPGVEKGHEDIYITSRQGLGCIRVKQGDRLGLYFPTDSAVGYKFRPNSALTFLYSSDDESQVPKPNNVVSFNSLPYPYDFSACAYLDTDISKYPGTNLDVDCPRDQFIPIEPTSSPTTPSPGLEGPPGPPGNDGAQGPPGATGGTGATGLPGPHGQKGVSGPVGPMGQRGPMGYTGQYGRNGTDGATGSQGPAGARGERGPVGIQGEPGIPASPASPNSDRQVEEKPGLFSLSDASYLVLALLIWLGIVTLLLIVTIILVAKRRSQPSHYQSNTARNHQPYGTKGKDMGQVNNYGSEIYDEPDYINEGRTAF